MLLLQQLSLHVHLSVRRQPRHVSHHAAVRKVYLRHSERLHGRDLLLVLRPAVASVLLRPATSTCFSLVEHRHRVRYVPDDHLSVETSRSHQIVLSGARVESKAEHLMRRLKHDLRMDQVDKVPQQDMCRVRLAALLDPLVEREVARGGDRDHTLPRGMPVDGGDRHVFRVFDIVVVAHLLQLVITLLTHRRVLVADPSERVFEDVDRLVLLQCLLDRRPHSFEECHQRQVVDRSRVLRPHRTVLHAFVHRAPPCRL
mmetsp:Transcript_34289/g.58964  ORF Transcript_34289/g.58964 Transcript_34289/m.58964 type:complete len:257 (-) Transcript_34289:65-835(-)